MAASTHNTTNAKAKLRMRSGDPVDRATPFRSLGYKHAQAIPDLAAEAGFRSFKAEGAVSLVAVPI